MFTRANPDLWRAGPLSAALLFVLWTAACGGGGGGGSGGGKPLPPDVSPSSETNRPPIAQAGADRTVSVGDTVTLDGSGSSDPDGDALSFRWRLVSVPAGSGIGLEAAESPRPWFTPDTEGEYVVRLVVSDGITESIPDEVSVHAVLPPSENQAPVADPGEDVTTAVGGTVVLNGEGGVDPDGDPLSYHWTVVSAPPGSSATLSDADSPTPTFVPDREGEYVIRLMVGDGRQETVRDVTVTALSPWSDPGEPAAGIEDSSPGPPSSAVRQTGQGTPEAVVVWEDDGDVMAATGNPGGVWEDPVRLDSGRTPVTGPPQVAADETGTVVTVWPEGNRIVFTRQDLNGIWTEPVVVAELDGPADKILLALNANGNGALAWEAGGRVNVRGYAKPANSWNVLPPLDPGEGTSSGIRVGVDGSNRVVVVWVREGSLWSTWNVLSEDPPAWAEPWLLNPGGEAASLPTLAVWENGEAVCVWAEGEAVFGALYSPEARWGNAVRLGALDAPISHLVLAADREEQALAAWTDGATVQAVVFRSSGWEAVSTLDSTGTGLGPLAASLAQDARGVVAWGVTGSGLRAAWWNGASGWVGPVWIHEAGGGVDALAVSAGPDGTATAVWVEDGTEMRASWFIPPP